MNARRNKEVRVPGFYIVFLDATPGLIHIHFERTHEAIQAAYVATYQDAEGTAYLYDTDGNHAKLEFAQS